MNDLKQTDGKKVRFHTESGFIKPCVGQPTCLRQLGQRARFLVTVREAKIIWDPPACARRLSIGQYHSASAIGHMFKARARTRPAEALPTPWQSLADVADLKLSEVRMQ